MTRFNSFCPRQADATLATRMAGVLFGSLLVLCGCGPETDAAPAGEPDLPTVSLQQGIAAQDLAPERSSLHVAPQGDQRAALATPVTAAENGGYSIVLGTAPLVRSGSSVPFQWTAAVGHNLQDLIGFYRAADPDNQPLAQINVPPGSSGNLFLNLSPSTLTGPYELRYRLRDAAGYGTVAKAKFNVVNQAFSIYRFGPIPSVIRAGLSFNFGWGAPTGHAATDFIGLYTATAPNGAPLARVAIPAGVTSGNLTVTLSASSPSGTYELRYIANGITLSVQERVAFQVLSQNDVPYGISSTLNLVPAGTEWSGDWTAPAWHAADDVLGFFRAGAPNNTPLAFAVVPRAVSGRFTLRIASSATAGTYELRYLIRLNNQWTAVALSAFEVTAKTASSLTGAHPGTQLELLATDLPAPLQ